MSAVFFSAIKGLAHALCGLTSMPTAYQVAVVVAPLENFHSLLLTWCPKRVHFFFEGMRARTQLACLSHNFNVNRQQAETADGTPRYRLVLLKAKGEWVVKKIYGQKSTEFLHDLRHATQDAKQCMLAGEQPECVKEYVIFQLTFHPILPENLQRHRSRQSSPTSQECCDELTLR